MNINDIKIGLKVIYDDSIMTIINYFPQVKNISPSGDVLLEDDEGTELVNHNEIELVEKMSDLDRFFKKQMQDDEFLKEYKRLELQYNKVIEEIKNKVK